MVGSWRQSRAEITSTPGSGMTSNTTLQFSALRSDWYFANEIVPRFLSRACLGEKITFEGFPRQWLPLFAWCGARWNRPSNPQSYMPVISDLSLAQLERLITTSMAGGHLRAMVESVACLDPTLADALYIVDNKTPISERKEPQSKLLLTSWASYGQPSVRAFEKRVRGTTSPNRTAVFLPCSRRRPYNLSTTHKRIWSSLAANNILSVDDPSIDKVVLTSLGVVPRSLWEDPVVLSYDAGVPDIYRLLRLLREFLDRHNYSRVIDCLSFEPYSDLLRITHREKRFGRLQIAPKRRTRRFYVRQA